MKKIFSALVALSMVLSMTAFAATNAKINVTADKTSVKADDLITFTITSTGDGDMSYYGGTIKFEYDETQLSIDTSSFATDVRLNGAAGVSTSTGTVTIQNSPKASDSTDMDNYAAGKLKGTFKIGEFKARVLNTAVPGATIKFNVKATKGVNVTYANVTVGATLSASGNSKITTIASMPDAITVASEESAGITESFPTTGAAGQGLVDKSVDEAGNYDIVAKAPIGKKAVITVDGAVVASGHIYKGKPSTSVKVEFVDDDATVITYPIVYQDADCAVVFGKGTIAEGDKYGIKVTDTTGFSKEKEATVNVGGIFGIQFNYVNAVGKTAPNGTYKAQAFVGSEYGEEITFTK